MLLIELFGETPRTRLLSFFMENPFDWYLPGQIEEITGLENGELEELLHEFEFDDIIMQRVDGDTLHYRTNSDNSVVVNIYNLCSAYGDAILDRR